MSGPVEDLRLAWRKLSDGIHVGSDAGRVVAILYTVDAGIAYEFWCLLTDAPEQKSEVLFGVSERAASAWATRWERGRRACEMVYAEFLSST